MRTLAIINQKGGVGKSTTALAVGAGLNLRGARVLYVDLDAQGNLSFVMDVVPAKYGAMGVLQRPETASEEIQRTEHGDIIPSSPSLTTADNVLIEVGKEYRLKEALAPLSNDYDYCIIDTAPSLGVLTVNALVACTGAIVPAQADVFSLQGIAQLNDTLQAVKAYCNPSLAIEGIVLTRFNSRTIISREVAELLEQTAERLETKLYNTRIRECTALKEAQAVQQSIFSYAPRSNAAEDYKNLIEEIVKG